LNDDAAAAATAVAVTVATTVAIISQFMVQRATDESQSVGRLASDRADTLKRLLSWFGSPVML